jgi:hypothetical protein
MEYLIAGAVITFLLGIIGFIVKLDIEATKKHSASKEEIETMKVAMESIVSSANVLAKSVEVFSRDVKENYVRKESVNGQLALIRAEQRRIAEISEKQFDQIIEKIKELSENKLLKEQIRELKTKGV